jgi:hypothetical protein
VRIIRNVIIAAVCLCVLWWGVAIFRVRWSFYHIEQHAREVITGAELQQWAEEILAQRPAPTDSDGVVTNRSELASPIPEGLFGLYHHPPDIFVHQATASSPGHVSLVWGGGLIGHCAFEIGPTNFVSDARHKWQDGVYFWTDP